jgi:hypothetical protein
MSAQMTSEQALTELQRMQHCRSFMTTARLEALRMAEAALRAQGELRWHLDQETSKFLADLITGGDEPAEITLQLGRIKDDDGTVQYGLLVCESEYPEEGYSLLVECADPSVPHPQGEEHGR